MLFLVHFQVKFLYGLVTELWRLVRLTLRKGEHDRQVALVADKTVLIVIVVLRIVITEELKVRIRNHHRMDVILHIRQYVHHALVLVIGVAIIDVYLIYNLLN